MLRRVLLSILVLGFCSSALADEIIFKSGDRLTGKLVQLEAGKLIFESAEVGKVTVDISRLESFSTEEPVEFHFQDGTVIKSKVVKGKPGFFNLEKTKILPAQQFPLDQIAAINPPVKPKVKWKGDITAGFSSTHGNTFSESGSLSARATRRSEKDRINVSGSYLVSRTKDSVTKDKRTTEESFTFGGKYDYFWTKKFYSYINGKFKKDHVADLDRRIIAGFGAGYQWVESDKMNFSTDMGISELCEQYTRRNPTTFEKETTRSDNVSLRFGYHYDWQITDKISFMHNMDYYPSVETYSDYFLTTDAELRLALTSSMYSSFKAILDYDSTPARGVGSTDTKYILGVGWSF